MCPPGTTLPCALLLLAPGCSEVSGAPACSWCSPRAATLAEPPRVISTLPVAWRDPALALICCRGWQTRQPPPGAGGGATRPVRAAEARAGAGARGDQASLQPPPARDRAGEWC